MTSASMVELTCLAFLSEGHSIEVGRQRYIEVKSCSSRFIDLDPLRFQVLKDNIKLGGPPRSTMGLECQAVLFKID